MSSTSSMNLSEYRLGTVAWCTDVVHRGTVGIKKSQSRLKKDCFEKTFEFCNYTDVSISVTDRCNLTTTFFADKKIHGKPSELDLMGNFIVRVKRLWKHTEVIIKNRDELKGSVSFDRFGLLNGYNQNPDDTHLNTLGKAYEQRMFYHKDGSQDFWGNLPGEAGYRVPSDSNYHNECMVVEYMFSKDRLLELGGLLYCPEIDMVIALDDGSIGRKPAHPYSAIGNAIQKFTYGEELENIATRGFTYHIEIIDHPEQRFGHRYINVNGRIKKIMSRLDPNKVPGVYLYESRDIGAGLTETFIEFRNKSKLDELGLYPDQASAEVYGCPKAINDRKRIADELIKARELEEIADRQRTQAEIDRVRRQEREDELYRRQTEAHEKEQKSRQENDHSEKKRRWWDGFFKVTASALAVVGAIIGLIVKYGPKKA